MYSIIIIYTYYVETMFFFLPIETRKHIAHNCPDHYYYTLE